MSSAPDTTAAERVWLEAWKAGPKRTRWTSLPPQRGDMAPDLRLTESTGIERTLSSLWSNKPLVLIFLRHYGCSCTWDRVKRLKAETPLLQALGAEVAAISQGDAARAREFAARLDLPVRLFCDPERLSYEAFGILEAGPSQIVYDMGDEYLRRDEEPAAKLQASRRGTPRVPVDSPWQLPGDVVIDQGGTVRLIHRALYCDDYVPADILFAALKEIGLGLTAGRSQ